MARKGCTLRAFSMGLKDWLREKSKPTIAEEVVTVYKQTNGFLNPAIWVTIVAILLLVIVKSLRAISETNALAGMPSAMPEVLAIALALAAVCYAAKRIFSFSINSLQFATSMCERGQQILDGTRLPVS
jgi:uncharacterized membrane protein YesL